MKFLQNFLNKNVIYRYKALLHHMAEHRECCSNAFCDTVESD